MHSNFNKTELCLTDLSMWEKNFCYASQRYTFNAGFYSSLKEMLCSLKEIFFSVKEEILSLINKILKLIFYILKHYKSLDITRANDYVFRGLCESLVVSLSWWLEKKGSPLMRSIPWSISPLRSLNMISNIEMR